VLAAGAGAEVLSADDDRIIAAELVLADEVDVPLRQPALALRDAAERVHPEELALLGERRVKRQVLRGDDLVGVDVIAEHVGAASDDVLHAYSFVECEAK
jgi:hypothetical protein